jgi:hypothetical protein
MQVTVQQLEGQLATAKELIARRTELQKLAEVRLFRKWILEEFCEKEAARFVAESADPALKPEDRADALALAQAGGHLKRWLSAQIQMANIAERQMREVETELEAARAEEAEFGADAD